MIVKDMMPAFELYQPTQLADALGGHLFNRTPVSIDMILNAVNGRPQAHKPLQVNSV